MKECSILYLRKIFRMIRERTCTSLREKCLYLKFFWSVFNYFRTKYGDFLSKSPHSTQMRENAEQKKSVYGHFLQSAYQGANKYCFF